MGNIRRSRARWCRALLPGLAWLLCAAAARGAPPDYTSAFQQLESLGAPSVSNATYVQLTLGWPPADEFYSEGRYVECMLPYDRRTVGNAWLLQVRPATNGLPASATFLVNGGELVDVERATEDADFGDAPTTDGAFPSGTWEPADLRTDAKRTLRFLKPRSREARPERSLDSRVQARLLLFALQLHQKGERDSAGQIANALLALIPGRRSALAAQNLLADSQYLNLYRTFRTDHNWKNYRNGLEALLDRYPSDWPNAQAAAMLLARVQQRLAVPAPLPIETNGLTELDLQQASALLRVRDVLTEPRYNDSRGQSLWLLPWLLPSAWATASLTNANADLQVRARGVQAIPLLMALIGDEALTETDARQVGVEAQLGALERPAMRGEVALRMLSEMLPRHVIGPSWDFIGDEKRAHKFLTAARAFFDARKETDEEDLAVLYLNDEYDNGDGSTALLFLLRLATERQVPALERYLLDSHAAGAAAVRFPSRDIAKSTRLRTELAVRYAAARGPEARPFIGQLVAMIEQDASEYLPPGNTAPSSPENDQARGEPQRAAMRKAAADLATMPYDASLDDLLANELAGNKAPGRGLLLGRLEALARPELVHALLQKAADVQDAAGRATLVRLLAEVEYLRLRDGDRPMAPGRDSNGAVPDAALWRTLVTMDDTSVDPTGARVADLFLCLHEQVFTAPPPKPPDPRTLFRMLGTGAIGRLPLNPHAHGARASTLILDYGPRGRDFVLGRVLARLDGRPEPACPGQTPVPSATLDSLTHRLEAVTTRDEAAALAAGLPLPEFAALPDILLANAALNARLSAFANTITQVSALGDAALQQRLEPWVGRTLSPELIQLLEETCAVATTNGNAVSCLFAREEGFGGCSVRVETLPTGEPPKKVVGYTGLVCARGICEPCAWRTTPTPAKVCWGTLWTDHPVQRSAFQKAAEDLCRAKSDACSASIVKFTTFRETEE
jgi:hypothetical protein